MKFLYTLIFIAAFWNLTNAQLPPWNLEFYVFHPDGHTDTLWVGCDENATAGYDEGLDIIDTTFNTPIAIRGFSEEVDDAFNFNTCVNLKKDIRPFGYPAEFTFYILHDEIGTTDSVYLGWDTSMLNYEVGEYLIEGAILFSSNGYLEGIDGSEKVICSRSGDLTFNINYQPIPIFSNGSMLTCNPINDYYILKVVLSVGFKDYGVLIDDDNFTTNTINIFYSPANNNIHLQSHLFQAVQATIYDNFGRSVFTLSIKSEKQVVDISNFHSGIYYLKLSDGNSNKSFVYKFIKL